jgi:hypothetical protein
LPGRLAQLYIKGMVLSMLQRFSDDSSPIRVQIGFEFKFLAPPWTDILTRQLTPSTHLL